MISGFLAPNGGRIEFDGETSPVCRSARSRRTGLVRTYQLVQLFKDLTVAENVQVGFHLVDQRRRGAALLAASLVASTGSATCTPKRARPARFRGPRRAGRAGRRRCSPTASSACSRSRARSPRSRACCCSTSPRPASTRTRPTRSPTRHPAHPRRGITVLLIEHDMSAGDAHRAAHRRCSTSARRSPRARRTRSSAIRTSSPPISARRRRRMPDAGRTGPEPRQRHRRSGSIYGLIAIGFCVIYNASGIVNFAQGVFVMLGGMFTHAMLIRLGWPMPFPRCRIPLVAAVGVLVQFLVIRPMWKRRRRCSPSSWPRSRRRS